MNEKELVKEFINEWHLSIPEIENGNAQVRKEILSLHTPIEEKE